MRLKREALIQGVSRCMDCVALNICYRRSRDPLFSIDGFLVAGDEMQSTARGGMTPPTGPMAFGVFSGGGGRGAALVGAYGRACDEGVRFLGFGGTSAGAIVAAFAAAGYTAEEIRALMKKPSDLRVSEAFREPGRDVGHLVEAGKKLFGGKRPSAGEIGRRAYFLKKHQKEALSQVFEELGVLKGDQFEGRLRKALAIKLGFDPEIEKLTFAQFFTASGRQLRVVASDVSVARPKVFSAQLTPDACVARAVRASAAYPGAFQPVRDGAEVLTDGGLASNTPAFLFEEEAQHWKLPSFVFQLEGSIPGPGLSSDAAVYLGALVSTAVDASDTIVGSLSTRVHAVEIAGLDSFGVITPDLSDEDVDRLYRQGYEEAAALAQNPEVRRARRVAARPRREPSETGSRFGPPSTYETVLIAFRTHLHRIMRARGVNIPADEDHLRVSIFFQEWGDGAHWRIGFSHGFRSGDQDIAISLDPEEGSVPRAARRRRVVIQDVVEQRAKAATAPAPFAEQLALVPADRATVMAFPIVAFSSDLESDTAERQIQAVLAADTSVPLVDTGWLGAQTSSPSLPFDLHGELPPGSQLDRSVATVWSAWTAILSQLLAT